MSQQPETLADALEEIAWLRGNLARAIDLAEEAASGCERAIAGMFKLADLARDSEVAHRKTLALAVLLAWSANK